MEDLSRYLSQNERNDNDSSLRKLKSIALPVALAAMTAISGCGKTTRDYADMQSGNPEGQAGAPAVPDAGVGSGGDTAVITLMNRRDILTELVRDVMGQDVSGECEPYLTDIEPDSEFCNAFNYLSDLGVMEPFEGGYYAPSDTMSRHTLWHITSRVLGFFPYDDTTGAPDINPDEYPYAGSLTHKGFRIYDRDGVGYPDADVTEEYWDNLRDQLNTYLDGDMTRIEVSEASLFYFGPTAGYLTDGCISGYADIPDGTLECMVSGYSFLDGVGSEPSNFRPQDLLNYAEFSKLMTEVVPIPIVEQPGCAGVDQSAWFARYMDTLCESYPEVSNWNPGETVVRRDAYGAIWNLEVPAITVVNVTPVRNNDTVSFGDYDVLCTEINFENSTGSTVRIEQMNVRIDVYGDYREDSGGLINTTVVPNRTNFSNFKLWGDNNGDSTVFGGPIDYPPTGSDTTQEIVFSDSIMLGEGDSQMQLTLDTSSQYLFGERVTCTVTDIIADGDITFSIAPQTGDGMLILDREGACDDAIVSTHWPRVITSSDTFPFRYENRFVFTDADVSLSLVQGNNSIGDSEHFNYVREGYESFDLINLDSAQGDYEINFSISGSNCNLDVNPGIVHILDPNDCNHVYVEDFEVPQNMYVPIGAQNVALGCFAIYNGCDDLTLESIVTARTGLFLSDDFISHGVSSYDGIVYGTLLPEQTPVYNLNRDLAPYSVDQLCLWVSLSDNATPGNFQSVNILHPEDIRLVTTENVYLPAENVHGLPFESATITISDQTL